MTSPALAQGTITVCPACAGPDVKLGPVSQLTGRRIGRCPRCHAHFWANPAAPAVLAVPTATAATSTTAEGFSEWVDLKREQAGPEAWRDAAAWLRTALSHGADRRPRLYDVGAGDGQFLQIARDEYGFDVSGNDIVPGAVALAKERYDVALELGDLADLDHHQDVDAVTLWCVLAHVPDADALLRQVHRMLRPGGYVVLQTPHWTAADEAAYTAQRASRGRLNRLSDRRVARHHRILHTRKSITAQLERLGFTDVEAIPRQRYSLTSRAYLLSMNPPTWSVRPASWLLDRAVNSKLAPRIVLDVRARRR